MLKKVLLFTLFAALFTPAFFAIAEETIDEQAECDKPWSVDLQTDFYSAYMFRGQNLFDGASIQPSIVAGYDFGDIGSVGGYVWSHLSADEQVPSEDRYTEIDYSLFYSFEINIVSLEAGLLWYTYPREHDNINDTAEFYGKIALDLPLNPSLTYFRDYEEFDVDYYQLGISQEVEAPFLGDGFKFTPYLTMGFASNSEAIYEENGLETITIGATFDTSLGDFGVIPNVHYNFKIDDNTDNQFWFGVTFKYGL